MAGSRRVAVRRHFVSLSSRLLHSTILDFRVRLLLLAALTLPFILLGGLLHTLASGRPWTHSAYLVYGLLFRVPALGAVRIDEPPASAAVLNAVFLFGTFGFAILLGLIGEEVKGTVKALRTGGAPLDLYGHVVLLNFTADATAVALLRQLAEDVARPGSPLHGRPVVVLAAPPPPAAGAALTGASGGGSGGDVEGTMKRVVADALQGGRGACEWHLRVGASSRTDDLGRVCAGTAAYLVLLADPRVGAGGDAPAAGAAFCLQAQSLMCLTMAASGGAVALLRGRQQANIVVQSPASALAAIGGGPIATFRSVAAAEGNRALVNEVRDRGIVDRLVAQTVLQPGVATVLARLFGSSGGEGTGFRWVEWRGNTPPPPAADAKSGQGEPAGGAAKKGAGGGTGAAAEAAEATGLRRRRLLGLPRTLSYSSSQRTTVTEGGAANPAAAAGNRAVGGSSAAPAAASVKECAVSSGGAAGTSAASMGIGRSTSLVQSSAACLNDGGNNSGTEEASRQEHGPSGGGGSSGRAGTASGMASAGGAMVTAVAAAPGTPRAKPHQLAVGRGSGSTYGEVRAALETPPAAAPSSSAHSAHRRSHAQHRHRSRSPAGTTTPQSQLAASSLVVGGGSGGRAVVHHSFVVVGYLSAATGTLRLNPRDASPVYPGDQLVLLVSDQAPYAQRSGGGSMMGGWWPWGRVGGQGAAAGVVVGGAGAEAGSGARLVDRRRQSAAGGREGIAAATDAHYATPLQQQQQQRPQPQRQPLQGWQSEPLDRLDARPSSRLLSHGGDGGEAAPPGRSAFTAVPAATKHGAAGTASGDGHPNGGGTGASTSTGADGGGGGGAGRGVVPASSGSTPRAPPAPPQHIIVLSRNAAAVREVLAGLQEFAPAGSTVALLTQGSAPPSSAQPSADVAAGPRQLPHPSSLCRPSSERLDLLPPVTRMASGFASASAVASAQAAVDAGGGGGSSAVVATGAAGGSGSSTSNGITVLLPCSSSTWPPAEADLVAAGLAHANAVLVARDSGLLPHEADATALSTVLQLHHTLSDPTRSPLRRAPSVAAAAAAAAVTAAAVRLAASTRVASLLGAKAASNSGGAADGDGDVVIQPGASQLPELPSVPDSPTGPAGSGRAGAGVDAPVPPLHVVVCLHSTRARATLQGFLAGLNAKPPFTLEALVPEEYRALLLAGVVRQPQSHAIMTDLLSDRPGAPEVYLVPPARLLAAATAAQQQGGAGGKGGSVAVTDATAEMKGGAAVGKRQPLPGGAALLSVPPQALRFRDVALAARACGCTAIGVLRGGSSCGSAVDGAAGGAGSLHLAPPPDSLLSLGAGDRLVVLAADPV